jgi:hypothetical protein
MEEKIENLMQMGFERPKIEQCLCAAFGNPERAVEYLTSEMPDNSPHTVRANDVAEQNSIVRENATTFTTAGARQCIRFHTPQLPVQADRGDRVRGIHNNANRWFCDENCFVTFHRDVGSMSTGTPQHEVWLAENRKKDDVQKFCYLCHSDLRVSK